MIAVADVNTLWRSKPFEALSVHALIAGFAPADPVMAWRHYGWPLRRLRLTRTGMFYHVPILMPPGWATYGCRYACRRMAQAAKQTAACLEEKVQTWMITSPHYWLFQTVLKHGEQLCYYCSDDYSAYKGWGGIEVQRREKTLMQQTAHNFFVSQVLADRAVHKHGIPAHRVSVSPNATDERFLQEITTEESESLLAKYPNMNKPIVGVIGGINDRLDYGLLKACAGHPSVGTMLMIGPVDASLAVDPAWQRLQTEKRCVVLGSQPHEELPRWMAAIDVALIPYRATPLNHACSPMRLFDHLASGKIIVATNACDQIQDYDEFVRIADRQDDFVELMANALSETRSQVDSRRQREFASAHTWRQRAVAINSCLSS